MGPDGAVPPAGKAVFHGFISGIDFHGATSMVRVRLEGGEHTVSSRVLGTPPTTVRPGERVSVTVHRLVTTL